MLIDILKSKIHRAVLTDASVQYPGSFGIDQDIMDKVGIFEYEKLLIININSGHRFETYCIKEERGSNKFSLYGGAARLGAIGDPVIILSFTQISEEDIKDFKPKIINYS